jgi:5-methylcytosine-specific restriction endonuclease McrA
MDGEAAVSVAPARDMRAQRPAHVKPLAPERYKIQFTVSREVYEKLRHAQDLLRHAVPDGDPSVIFERALALLVTDLERTKIGATDRPRTPRPRIARPVNVASRRIPAAIKRFVWQRDGGQCAFTGPQGRCTATGFLEYHHVVPFAAGGEMSAGNIVLLCRTHNQYEAERYFGPAHVPLLRERPAMYGRDRSFRNKLIERSGWC